jgi:multidrug resistance efflux pump
MNQLIRASLFRILRVTVLVLVLIALAVWLRNILTSLESEQAVINAEIIQIRTPITGVLEIDDVRPGMLLAKGQPLFKIVNPRFGDRETVAQFNTLQTQVESLRAELASARRELEVADVEQKRARRLYKAEVIARVEKELAETRFVTLRQLVDIKTEQLARTVKRSQEMEAQMKLQKESVVTMPADGLIWTITGKNGEHANSNALVMEVINPSRIWVDAFFAERHAKELKPGLPAMIRSLDSTASWQGRLESIRAGVGRLAYDTTVAVPPPEMAKRQIAVRVDVNWERPFSAVEFFGVGRSVEVKFAKGKGQRTVGDVLKDKWERTFAQPERTTAKAGLAE